MLIALVLLASQAQVSDTLWTETGEGYEISVRYPVVAVENEEIGTILQDYAEDHILSFREMYEDYYADDPILPDWSFELAFTHEDSPDGMTVIMSWLWYYTGGAHGNTRTRAFLYDHEKDGWISTVELLGGEENFRVFAEEVIEKLNEDKNADEGWILLGASAQEENYHSVIPIPGDDGGIEGYTVYFPPYQVACYACGTIDVYIPAD
ncbi:MAG: DUF4163 domain-containing protein [Candidatus Aegiribacteria sp.]|nr:DUF4163 domain-containing protein [Candidatus Aegiribacteria sp.]